MKGENALLSQWRNEIEEFQFTILHWPRKAQGHMDWSRLPLPPSIAMISDMVAVTEELQEVARDTHGNPDTRNVIVEG